MSAVAIIPARGGSRRIPGKNIRAFHGRPILAYAVRAARDSGLFDEVMVSTDDDRIASVARECGAAVPFRRSAAAAGDHATTLDVLREVIAAYRARDREFEALCCLYPTAALTDAGTLRAGQALLAANRGADCVVPVVRYGHPIQRAFAIQDGRLALLRPESASARSQDLEPAYHDAGQWYWMRTRRLDHPEFSILGAGSVPMVLEAMRVQDIDNEDDWALAEAKYALWQRSRSG